MERVNLIHQNNHMMQNMVHPADMMYYYYMSQQGNFPGQYPGKSEPYLHYAGHSLSPNKNNKPIPINPNSPLKSTQPFSPIYPSQEIISPPSTALPPVEIKEG